MQIIYAISVGRLHKEKKQTNINFTYSCYWIWQRATDIIVGYGNVPTTVTFSQGYQRKNSTVHLRTTF